MAKKINLTVPDDLYDKMQEWKDSFNYSGIFQKAVAREIKFEEEFQQRLEKDVDMEQIILRLREEKKEAEANCYRAGRERGLLWARAASFDSLRVTIRYMDEGIDFGTQPTFEKIKFLDEEMKETSYLNYRAWLHREYDKMNDEFLRGFLKSVWEFWKKVRDKL